MNNIFRGLLITSLVCTNFMLPVSYADQHTLGKQNSTLQSLDRKIKRLQKKLSADRNQVATLRKELTRSEESMDKLNKTLVDTKRKLQNQRENLQLLNRKTLSVQNKLDTQNELLAKQIQAAYKVGDYSYLKLLLNQENPYNISRLLNYYRYVTQARGKFIETINTTLNELLSIKQEIAAHTETLQNLLKKEAQTKHELELSQAYSRAVMQRLNEDIRDKDLILQNLLSEKKSLEKIISQFQVVEDSSAASDGMFSRMRRKLPWPAQGEVIDLYGTRIGKSKISYNGVLIKANVGEPVRAIYSGRVAFANYLKGFGKLLIIEHGNGYMTLYAHNSVLHKKQGDKVSAGDLIASVGKSGRNLEDGLYFEIRRYSKPLNPVVWCTERVNFASTV